MANNKISRKSCPLCHESALCRVEDASNSVDKLVMWYTCAHCKTLRVPLDTESWLVSAPMRVLCQFAREANRLEDGWFLSLERRWGGDVILQKVKKKSHLAPATKVDLLLISGADKQR